MRVASGDDFACPAFNKKGAGGLIDQYYKLALISFFTAVLTASSVSCWSQQTGVHNPSTKTLPAPPTNSGPPVIDPHVGKNDTIVLPAYIVNGDTLAHIWIGNIDVRDKMIYHNPAERENYLRLKRDVMTVLPYAQYAGYRYRALEFQLSQTKDAKKKRELVRALEKDIKQNYAKALTNLTITQGRILIKLVDRETGQTSYNIVKEMKNGFSAFVFQSVAGLFGDNLKDHYDPVADKDIEFIIHSIGAY